MSLRCFSDIKLPLGKSESELKKIAEKKLGKKAAYFAIKKKSLDARNKADIRYVYTVEISAEPLATTQAPIERLPKHKLPKERALIVGSGPAGLFCALRLIERGIAPILIERGASVDDREKSVQAFIQTHVLDTNSNVQFGEGGAGTFSDGKLNTQTHNALNAEVLKTFVKFGAPEEILWLQKPHIGSDNLKTVVKNMREHILANGGEVRFRTLLKDVRLQNQTLQSVTIQDMQTGKEEVLTPSVLVLAIGHSARDTFSMLCSRGVQMRAKDFAVGVRVEHLQSKISFAQYGKAYTMLPAADYKLVSHASERAAFTFCMCPGGFVMPSSSEEYGVVTNGMSNYARNERNANAALIAQVRKTDFLQDADKNPLAGVEYQRAIEQAAYQAGGGNYAAPVQLVGDFLADKVSSKFGEVLPSYAIGTAFADFRSVLPAPIAQTLKTAIVDMDKRLKGFACPDAVLTAAETRTSSPVRIERDENSLQSVNANGVYPCGEGAGYAGGITSSAADGLRIADAIYANFLK